MVGRDLPKLCPHGEDHQGRRGAGRAQTMGARSKRIVGGNRQSSVEELDSDDDTDTQGVGLNFDKKRFASDPLQFTGYRFDT